MIPAWSKRNAAARPCGGVTDLDTERQIETLPVNAGFRTVASAGRLDRVAKALRSNGIDAVVVDKVSDARAKVLELVPTEAEVGTGTSESLSRSGILDDLASGRYDYVAPKIRALDRATQAGQIRKLRASPNYMLGSVHAVTEDGVAIVASQTGSQLGPYANGAERVIWVIGGQKIVSDLDEGLRRIREYSYPMMDAEAQRRYGVRSGISKVLIVFRETVPHRITAILVREELGY